MNLDDLSAEELATIINDANAILRARRAQDAQDDEDRRAAAGQAAAQIDALVGPEGSAPYDPVTGENFTINGVLAHDTEDHAVLAAYTGHAHSAELQGLRALAGIVRNIALIVATD